MAKRLREARSRTVSSQRVPQHGNMTQLPEPNNIHSITKRLSTLNTSSSETNFTSNNFKRFRRAGVRMISDSAFKTDVLLVIRSNSNVPGQDNLLFDKLTSVTSSTIVSVVTNRYNKTDFYKPPTEFAVICVRLSYRGTTKACS